MTLPIGHSIWVYEADDDVLTPAIRKFNAESSIPVKYFFVYDGSVTFDIHFENTAVDYYAANFPDAQIYANLDGWDSELAELTDDQKRQLATTIGEKYNKDDRIAGLHIDVEPFSDESVSFYALLKEALEKPLSVALYAWNDEILKICDLPVLMGYDLGNSPQLYSHAASRLIHDFIKAVHKKKRSFMIGLPFVATHEEYEFRRSRDAGVEERSGHSMNDFLREGFSVISKLKNDPDFIGIAIWGGVTKPIGVRTDTHEYFPFRISQENWNLLKS